MKASFHRKFFLFIGSLTKLIYLAIALIAFPSTSQASFINIGYAPFLDGANALLGLGKFVVGGTYFPTQSGLSSEEGSTEFKGSQTMAKVGFYTKGLGTSSFYITAGYGKVTLDGVATSSLGRGVGSTSSTIKSVFAGYHIFEGIFDVKFGIGVRNYSGWNDMILTSATGVKIATVKVANLRSTVPTLDLGVGLNF